MDTFDLFNIMGPIFFIFVFGFILFVVFKGIGEWNKNNQSPKLSVPVQVVTKRTKTSGGSGNSSASTSYFVTFQVDSGDRMELRVSGPEYGMIAEEDLGILTFQGTRFHSFERN